MEALGTVLLYAALFSPFVALLAAVVVYLDHRKSRAKENRRSVALFSLGVVGSGLVLWMLGTVVGIGIFCAVFQNAQCGLGGVFFAGPAGFSVGAAIFMYFWVKRGKAP